MILFKTTKTRAFFSFSHRPHSKQGDLCKVLHFWRQGEEGTSVYSRVQLICTTKKGKTQHCQHREIKLTNGDEAQTQRKGSICNASDQALSTKREKKEKPINANPPQKILATNDIYI